MREIVTLQLGSLANHVGTHFWNSQVEVYSYTNIQISISNQLHYIGRVFQLW
jgi:hypothetical protein